MEDFPDEILEQILKNIKIPEIFSLIRVCKEWRRIITSGNVVKLSDLRIYYIYWYIYGAGLKIRWDDVVNKIEKWPTNINDNFVSSLVQVISPRVTDINLSHTDITDKGIETICEHFNNFRKVNFEGCTCITSKGISTLARTNIHLQYVSLGGHRDPGRWDMLGNVWVILLAEYCRELRIFSFTYANISDDSTLYMAERCTDLIKIDFSNTDISSISAIKFATHCPHLQYARFDWCENMTEDAVFGMGENCNNVLTASFDMCPSLEHCDNRYKAYYLCIINGNVYGETKPPWNNRTDDLELYDDNFDYD